MARSKRWTLFICITFNVSLIQSTDISLNGSKDYINSHEPFTLTCSSSTIPRGKTAYFFKDTAALLNVIYSDVKSTCYGIPQDGRDPYNCSKDCSCSNDYTKYTVTYNGLITNKSVTFKCQMSFGNNITSPPSNAEITVDKASKPSSIHLIPDKQSITVNETDLVGPITCEANCVPNCKYRWIGPGITEEVQELWIPNIPRNRSDNYTCIANNVYGNATINLEVLVQYGPDIINLNPIDESYTVEENTSLAPVECISSCYPVCKQEWTGPGISATANQLKLTYVRRSNEGKFTCTASNVVSSLQKQISITVEYGPSVVSLFPNTTTTTIKVNEQDQIGPISCTANCVPACKYSWSGLGISGEISSLEIVNIQRNRSGTYKCAAKNTYGNETVDIHIDVQFGPEKINLSPSNLSYTIQENTSFGPINCTSRCHPFCNHEWIGPGEIVAKEQLYINNITRNNSGNFTCTANNTVNSLQKTVSIIVTYGPSYAFVNSSQSNIIVNESGQVGPIQCTAECVPVCTYTWNGPDISGVISELRITNIRRNQTGNYTCTAMNNYGSKTVVVHIVVHYGPSAVTVTPSNTTYTIKENSSLDEMGCSSICFPSCSSYWTGPALPDKKQLLHLTNIQRNQTGNYTCITYNGVGEAQIEISVTVLYPARVVFVNTTQGIYVFREHSSVSFVCRAEGLPIPEMSWKYVNTNGIRKVLNTTNSLQTKLDISSAKCTDTGTYICEANNKIFSSNNISRELNVTCAPRLHKNCSSGNFIPVKSNMTLSVEACFISNPAPNINWTLIDGNSSTSIENDLSKVHQNSSILYTALLETKLVNKRQEQYIVYAYNGLGESRVQTFTVVVEDRPFPPMAVKVECSEINTLYWTSNYDGGSEQVFRVIYFLNNITAIEAPENISDTTAGTSMYKVLRNLKPNKHYIFQVIAINKFNQTASNSVHCLTAAPLSMDDKNMSGLIGGITGTLLGAVLIAIGITVFWIKRRKNNHAESQGRKKLTSSSKEDEEEDGLRDNILYESAGPNFVPKEKIKEAKYSTVTKVKEIVKFTGDSNIQETALYAEVVKKSRNDQNGDVYNNELKSQKLKEKNKGRKKGSREDVYENMSGEVANAASNFQEKENRNKDGLIYADLTFNPSPNGPRFIHGIDDRTIYSDVDTTQKIDPLPDSDEEDTPDSKQTE